MYGSVLRAAELIHVDLGGEWQLTQDALPDQIPAKVPGCVHLDLLAAGKIPDPFYRDSQKLMQWIGDASWTYSRRFPVSAELLSHEHVLLRCEGLDTVAAISINDQTVAQTDNMYRTYEFDVKDLLKTGENRIGITFLPIGPYIKSFVESAKGPNSSSKGMANLRKAPYSNGWDFGPRFLTAGIYKPIELLAFDQGRITRVAVTTNVESSDRVSLDIDAHVQNGDQPLSAIAILALKGTVIAASDIVLEKDNGHCRLDVPKPQLWWPNGMGAQPLYDLHVVLNDRQGKSLDEQKIRIGLRKIELLPKSDSRPLRLAVNGREMYAKGADWIPCDMFAPRVTSEKVHRYMADAAAVNMNMIRCWGGGYYEEDAFYDACDEMGILVWSEFKFACAVYPGGNPAFVQNVRAEVTDQVNRLRNHPSIAVWCGNNEVTSLITGYRILRQKDYDALFHGVIGEQLQALMPEANYVGGSPEAGDEHNWWVWHVGANFEKYLDSHGWMTEFGFQSFPCPATVDSYTEPGDRKSALSPVMKAHQHNGNGRGNEMILEMMDRYFRTPKDFDSMLWLSQINQAYGVTMGIEHWRSDWPRSSGSLVWQYDDCWPGPTWASVDYYGRWKALHYELRDAYAPLMVTAQCKASAGKVDVTICSDRAATASCDLHWRLTDTDGKTIREENSSARVPAGTCSVAGPSLELGNEVASIGRKNALLWIDLLIDGKVVSQKVIWFVRPKSLNLQDPQLTSSAVQVKDGFDVTIKAVHPALWAWADLEGDPDARWSDNFVHIAGGGSLRVHVAPSIKTSLTDVVNHLKVRSLFDTSLPEAPLVDREIIEGEDGSLVATAVKAEIVGNSAKLETGSPANVGGWTDAGDELEWTLNAKHAGAYRVSMDASCPAGTDGSEIAVIVGDARVTGVVPATDGWTSYKVADLGVIHVAKSGRISLTLRVIKMPHANVMNLRSITLRPVESKQEP